MRRIRIFLFLALVFSALAGMGLRAVLPEKKMDESVFLKEVAPDSVFGNKGGSPPHYSSGDGTVAFNTYDITPGIRGYAGPIKLLLALDNKGTITGIRILGHKETPNYVAGMERPEFLGQFLGKGVNDPIRVDEDIDGVSRATVSVRALADTVRESERAVARNVLRIEVKGDAREGGMRFDTKLLAYILLFAFALSAYFITRRHKRLLRLRDLSLLLSILIIGFRLSAPFSILHVFNILLLRPSLDILWISIVITVFLSIAVAGRFYCGWLCPFGALSEFMGRLPLRKWRIPPDTDDRWRNPKYLLLGAAMLIVILSGRPEFGSYETYVTLFSFHGNSLTWALVSVSLIASLRVERFWCRYLCPAAAFTGVLSKKAEGYVSRHDCPMANKPMPLISECIRCNRCYKAEEPGKP
jgi:Na+-translocating ferredoxin:NAD+ oxidoreductase RnfG subunit